MENKNNLTELAKLIRYWSLVSTTKAGSGHPTSSLSATDLMTVLMFGGFFKFDFENPGYLCNDRLIFSKGHASPLYYALFAAAGVVPEEKLMTLRKFGSPFEGHPTPAFLYTEAATGSLGQGLSIGVGMALNAKRDALPYRTYVLLGDSEMAEGSVWEAMEIAAYYKLNNLIGIIDVNRLGQRGETMYGHDLEVYERRAEAFGWHALVIDGHSLEEIDAAYRAAQEVQDKPTMIIAKTFKGKGVSFIEDKDGWHGKALSEDDLKKALSELGTVDTTLRGAVAKPPAQEVQAQTPVAINPPAYPLHEPVATRKAYGKALVRIFPKYPHMVVLDAEVSNSTFAEMFQKAHPDNFFEMFIAEQNMVGVGLGFARRGKIPFISSFAAFLIRAADQIRMCQYSNAHMVFVGSHAGVSIGQDGASQMALEDISFFRTLSNSTVLYPSDAVSTEQLLEAAAGHKAIVFIRTTRADTPILYTADEQFPIGGSKVLQESIHDAVTVIGAGITLHEALKAHGQLAAEHIALRVIDLYSIKPLDARTLKKAAKETKAIITVEDHYPEGGIGEAVAAVLSGSGVPVYSLAVRKPPKSGKPEELLGYEEISSDAIIKKVKELVKSL